MTNHISKYFSKSTGERLLNALHAWKQEAIKPEPVGAITRNGLCSWLALNRLHRDTIYPLLQDQYSCDNASYPFGQMEYTEGRQNLTMHLCPKRRAWVDKTIKELEEWLTKNDTTTPTP